MDAWMDARMDDRWTDGWMDGWMGPGLSSVTLNDELTFLHYALIWCIGQPSGLNAARKLRNTRREQRWADKQYKKRALGTAFRSNPFGGASHAKGIVLEKM
jgi:hypothetical protein